MPSATPSPSAVRLTPIEYRLLETLAVNAGRLCTHRFLLERVWGPGYGEQSQYLRVYMANLRKKLDDPAATRLLPTEPGMGYRFIVPGTGRRPRLRYTATSKRDVAQLGSAPRSGRGGPGFKSRHPDRHRAPRLGLCLRSGPCRVQMLTDRSHRCRG